MPRDLSTDASPPMLLLMMTMKRRENCSVFVNFLSLAIGLLPCIHTTHQVCARDYASLAPGLRNTRMTESPRTKSLLMKRSLGMGLDFFLPLPLLGTSSHISFTSSSTCEQRDDDGDEENDDGDEEDEDEDEFEFEFDDDSDGG